MESILLLESSLELHESLHPGLLEVLVVFIVRFISFEIVPKSVLVLLS